jgi:hypothetical protein
MSEENGRTHEPSLREITVELDGLRALLLSKLDSMRELLKERDEARRTAVDAALTAVKEQTKASFEASEKAIIKAEEAQKSYNVAHNDLARKMDEQNKATMPRLETESRFISMEEKFASLKSAMDKRDGSGAGMNQLYIWIVAAAGLALGVAAYFHK